MTVSPCRRYRTEHGDLVEVVRLEERGQLIVVYVELDEEGPRAGEERRCGIRMTEGWIEDPSVP